MNVAFDFGITNTDVVVENESENQFFTFPSKRIDEDFIKEIFADIIDYSIPSTNQQRGNKRKVVVNSLLYSKIQ